MFRLEGDARVIEGWLDMNSYPRKRSRDADEQGAAVREKRRQPRKVNPANPVKKLTTGLLETYKAINQLYYQKKKGGLRRDKLWQLLKSVEFYMSAFEAVEPGSDEIEGLFVRFEKAVSTWLWIHVSKDQCFNVETAFQQLLKSVGPDRDLSTIMRALQRFHLGLERLKLAEHTFADHQGNYVVETGEMFCNGRYCMAGYAGGGAFCKAWKAFDRQTGEKVCIKIIGNRKPHSEQSRREIKILKFLNEQSPDSGIVRLKSHFVFREHQCLVFTVLAYDLYELLKNENFKGVSLKLVRKFAVQILNTLSLLATSHVRLIHCDLKPENIMVVKHNHTTVNVIDFGSSCFGEEQGSLYVQSRFYRSPEVLLGIPYGTQIDVWSFGCIMFEMHTGRPLFTGKDAEDQLMKITNLLGRPNEAMMKDRRFFLPGTKEGEKFMKQPEAFSFSERFRRVGYAIITRRQKVDDIKTDDTGRVVDEDLLQFIDLVTKCLDLDPETRITPEEALRHHFFQKLKEKGAKVAAAAREEVAAASSPPAVKGQSASSEGGVATAAEDEGMMDLSDEATKSTATSKDDRDSSVASTDAKSKESSTTNP